MTQIRFGEAFPTDESLLNMVSNIQGLSGSNLDTALSNAKDLFDNSRPNARKVLVVIADYRSGKSENEIEMAANGLENAGVQVIPVAFGSESVPKELEKTTGNKKNMVNSTDDEDPEKIAKKIMDKFFESNYLRYTFLLLRACCS